MASADVSMVSSVSSVLFRNDSLETYSLIWIDSLVNSNENRTAQQQLRSVVNHIRVFENSTACETYIRQLQDGQILLIVSGQLGMAIVPLIHSLRQIISIYVYCVNTNKHKKWSSEFIKIRAVVTDLNDLIEKIKADRNRREKSYNEPLPISIFNSVSNEERSSTNINGGFLHFQLLINGLFRLGDSQTSRDEFFEHCKKEYESNYAQLTILQKIEKSYVPEKALRYYTQYSFLYWMLNEALRVQNINALLRFQFFIRDLYQQLAKLQGEQDQTPIRVYRGQLMSKQELDILKISKGRFISMNSFLSTSLDRQISLSFVSSEHGGCCVLFEIDINPRLSYEAKPFANISSESQFGNEQEILFMAGSIFRLVDIHEKNEITVIQMELNGNYDHDVKLLFEHMKEESGKYDECLSFGHILYNAGMYDKAEQFYNEVLNGIADDHPLIAEYWGSLGLVKKAKGETEISYEWLNKSLKKYEQMGDRLGIAKSLEHLANIHQTKGEINQAINKYNQALSIFKELLGDQSKSVANCLNNLGAAYFAQCKFVEAVQYYMDALDIRKTISPHTHPNIAMTLNNIGNVYYANGEYDQALQYFKQALDIYGRSLPSEHPSIAETYRNMSVAYFKKGDCEQSLVFLNKASSIYANIFPPDHTDVRHCAKMIDHVNKKTTNK